MEKGQWLGKNFFILQLKVTEQVTLPGTDARRALAHVYLDVWTGMTKNVVMHITSCNVHQHYSG